MLWRILATWAIGSQLLYGQAMSAERQQVALTVRLSADADKARKDLAGSLLALLEVRVSDDPQIAVVERMQIGLALNELVLNRSLNADEKTRLQLGRLLTADLILTVEFLKPEVEDEDEEEAKDGDAGKTDEKRKKPPRILIRIVEALTGTVRGVTVTPVKEAEVDDVASEIARYLSAVIEAPEQAGVTVAVGAFESAGRFDRLRPLELGIRDMVTAGLLNISKFRVLQRSGMEELNRELDLIRSGLADQSQLPKTLPTRKAAFLFHGTIDERTAGEERTIVVNGKLVHAASGQTVQDLRFESTPEELPDGLAHFVNLVAAHLVKSSARGVKLKGRGKFNETEYLYLRAISDLHRFRRRCPTDFSYRNFGIPGEKPPGARQTSILNAESILGRHLLGKSIDRLESVLFIQPEHPSAAYALAFCYAYNMEGIWNPKRAAGLLRSAYDRDPEGAIGSQALRLLAELSFHHSKGRIEPSLRPTAAEQIAFAFEHMPDGHRSFRWPRMLELQAGLKLKGDQARPLLQTMNTATALAEQVDTKQRASLTQGVTRLASALFLEGSPELQSGAQALLFRWGKSDDPELKLAASRTLGYLTAEKKNYPEAARWFLLAAETCERHPDRRNRLARGNFLMHAGRSYRRGGETAKALRVLESIEHAGGRNSLGRGYVDVEIGACYEALENPKKALEVYVTAAEEVPRLPDNSDVQRRILRLGGVPVREDRDFDVRYIPAPDKRPNLCRILATDGRRLFCGGSYEKRQKNGIFVYDLTRRTWQTIGAERGRVTCLAYHKSMLWVGTVNDGLWRYHLTTRRWRQWSKEERLPDQRIVSLTIHDGTVYAGIGTTSSGGLVRIGTDDDIHVFDEKNAPTSAPTNVLVRPSGLLVRLRGGIHEFESESNTWQRLPIRGVPYLYAGGETVWASAYGKELYAFDPSGKVDGKYSRAWFPKNQGKAGYPVKFVIEQDGQIWFGGSPWQRFKSAGFYRVDKKTGEFFMYGPRDGFELSTTYETYDGVQAAGRLWLATSAGLAEVDPRRMRD